MRIDEPSCKFLVSPAAILLTLACAAQQKPRLGKPMVGEQDPHPLNLERTRGEGPLSQIGRERPANEGGDCAQ